MKRCATTPGVPTLELFGSVVCLESRERKSKQYHVGSHTCAALLGSMRAFRLALLSRACHSCKKCFNNLTLLEASRPSYTTYTIAARVKCACLPFAQSARKTHRLLWPRKMRFKEP